MALVTTLRAQHPLTFALGVLVGAVVTDLLLIGGEVLAWVLVWRGQRV